MASINFFSLYITNEINDENKVLMNMTKYDLFIFLFSFFFTLEAGIAIIQQA